MRLRRVLRGVLGTAAAWGLAWIPLTLVTWGIAALFGSGPPLEYWGPMIAFAAARGAMSGAGFATVLALAGRRRTFESLQMRDMVRWGAVGGILAPAVSLGVMALTTTAVIPALSFGLGLGFASVLGAVCAAGTLWIARRAPELTTPTSRGALQAPADTA